MQGASANNKARMVPGGQPVELHVRCRARTNGHPGDAIESTPKEEADEEAAAERHPFLDPPASTRAGVPLGLLPTPLLPASACCRLTHYMPQMHANSAWLPNARTPT